MTSDREDKKRETVINPRVAAQERTGKRRKETKGKRETKKGKERKR
jgi:hypothetical protein